MQHGADLEKDNVSDESYLPRLYTGAHLSHYYGDDVRRMFMGIAVALLVSAPFLDGVLESLAPLHMIVAPVLIVLSALMSPKNKLVMMGGAAAAFVGALMFELIAFSLYRQGYTRATIGYELLALALVFSLYYTLKTVRAMQLGQIGRRDVPGEFLEIKHRETKDDF